MNKSISVEVAYATPKRQMSITVQVSENATLKDAIDASKILKEFPEIDLNQQKVGIFSKPKQLTDKVRAGDRIEIYRALLMDPKEIRRKKAKSLR